MIYQWILFSFVLSCLVSCGLFSKRKVITKKATYQKHFPQANYEGFHSHPARNLSQNCLEGQYAFTDPRTGIQRCSKLPKSLTTATFKSLYLSSIAALKTNLPILPNPFIPILIKIYLLI